MIRWIVDRIYSIRHPQGERKLTSTYRQWTEGRRKGRKRQMRGTDSKRMVTFSSRQQGGEITETNLSGGAGAMLLTAYWNALNSCLFNYANVHMQMTTVRNTMLSQLGDRLTRVGFRESDQIIALLSVYKQTAFDLWLSLRDISRVGWLADWEVMFCLHATACVGCTCGRLWTCAFTCHIYWFSSALQLLAALP